MEAISFVEPINFAVFSSYTLALAATCWLVVAIGALSFKGFKRSSPGPRSSSFRNYFLPLVCVFYRNSYIAFPLTVFPKGLERLYLLLLLSSWKSRLEDWQTITLRKISDK